MYCKMAAPDTVQLYRMRCTTENAYVTVWGETPPTTCPNNTAHVLDQSSIAAIQTVPKERIGVNVTKSSTSRDLLLNSSSVRISGTCSWRLGDQAPDRLSVRLTLSDYPATATIRCYEPLRGVVLGQLTTDWITVASPPTFTVPLTQTQFKMNDDSVYPIEVHMFRASGYGVFTVQDIMLFT